MVASIAVNPQDDELKSRAEEAVEYARTRGLVVFKGAWNGSEDRVFRFLWNDDNPNLFEFIEVAVALKAKVLCVQTRRLLEEDFREVLDSLDELEQDNEVEEIRRELRSLSSYIGKVFRLSIQFKSDDSIYMYEEQTDWAERFEEITDDVEDMVEEQEIDQE
ncbi:MAG: hypothetical protein QW767_02775 [Thermoprotei archaeon]